MTQEKGQITFVLPLKINCEHNYNELDREKNIQLESFKKFLDISMIKEFIVISPASEVGFVEKELSTNFPEFPFVFINEDVLFPSDIKMDYDNWRKQMLIKIAVSNIIKTPLYLTLDADVFLTKPLKFEDFFRDNKIIMTKARFDLHKHWWENSHKILDYEINEVKEQKLGMDVTPQILITEVAQKLFKEIIEIKKFNQSRFDENRCWTEYTLYWVYSLKNKLTDPYALRGKLYDRGIWKINPGDETRIEELVEKIFVENSDYHFSIFQSNIPNIDQYYLASLIKRYIDRGEGIS